MLFIIDNNNFCPYSPEIEPLKSEDIVIFAGDYERYIDCNETFFNKFLDMLVLEPCTYIFVDGTQKKIGNLYKYPIVDIFNEGGRAYKLRENVFHSIAGNIYNLKDQYQTLCMTCFQNSYLIDGIPISMRPNPVWDEIIESRKLEYRNHLEKLLFIAKNAQLDQFRLKDIENYYPSRGDILKENNYINNVEKFRTYNKSEQEALYSYYQSRSLAKEIDDSAISKSSRKHNVEKSRLISLISESIEMDFYGIWLSRKKVRQKDDEFIVMVPSPEQDPPCNLEQRTALAEGLLANTYENTLKRVSNGSYDKNFSALSYFTNLNEKVRLL